MMISMLVELFCKDKTTYTYSEIKELLQNKFELNSRQIAGCVGAAVRYGYIWEVKRVVETGMPELIFVG